MADSSDHFPASARVFSTTHWSVVLAAKQGDASEAALALEKLCRTYWPPLYAYIRRDGCDKTEAQDLTQEFFARLLARDYLQQLRHQEGKFRSFLLAYLKNFLSEQRRRAGAQKRGGDCVFVSLDAPAGEDGYLLEPVDELTPDQVFERRWAQAILQTALNRLREEFVARGQAAMFERLQDYQPREAGGRSDLVRRFFTRRAANSHRQSGPYRDGVGCRQRQEDRRTSFCNLRGSPCGAVSWTSSAIDAPHEHQQRLRLWKVILWFHSEPRNAS